MERVFKGSCGCNIRASRFMNNERKHHARLSEILQQAANANYPVSPYKSEREVEETIAKLISVRIDFILTLMYSLASLLDCSSLRAIIRRRQGVSPTLHLHFGFEHHAGTGS